MKSQKNLQILTFSDPSFQIRTSVLPHIINHTRTLQFQYQNDMFRSLNFEMVQIKQKSFSEVNYRRNN